ncbi:hypothetical protein B0H16DRAFT_1463482 [Mycena metata]|uniref:Uncharacterized protein n=1 Tax=Mycena metata TaxID=1033252 RepID=A0AAD7IKT9_9AGAR|nr:hypothetical protein B0H16DRAFT_1463482 [Mycena metata]
MKPNHHWAVHIPDQVLDLGPLNAFWAFLTERLNKILKNHNSNNWTGSRLEVSMMREFNRTSKLSSVVLSEPVGSDGSISWLKHEPVQLLVGMKDHFEAIGTVENATHAETSDGTRVVSGPVVRTNSRMAKEDILRFGLFQYYNKDRIQVHFAWNIAPYTNLLSPYVDFYKFALLNRK